MMRVNLNVPFTRKDEAKAQGAKWDAKQKTWYYFDQDLSDIEIISLACFLPRGYAKKIERAREQRSRKQQKKKLDGVMSERTDFSLLDCCSHLPPWEHCKHTLAAEEIEEQKAMDALGWRPR